MFLPLSWPFILFLMSHFFIGTLAWERKICSFDIEIRNSPQTMYKSMGAPKMSEDIMKCTVLDGDLSITMIHENKNETFLIFENIIEITGSLLVYIAKGLKSIDQILPNLRVIGGNSLISNNALAIYQNDDLENIGLNNLVIIKNGGIRISDNPRLCYSRFIKWDNILIEKDANIIVEQRNSIYMDDDTFYQCQDIYGCKIDDPKKCNKMNNVLSCWNSTTCQQYCPYHKLENDFIGPGCSPDGKKCHSSCLGGCFDTNNSSGCYACQKFEFNNSCIDECPSDTFLYKNHRCLTKEDCLRLLPARSAFRRMKVSWKAFYGQCNFECPDGYQEDPKDPHNCVVCENGFCPKICLGNFVDSAEDATKFSMCNIIDGNLTVMLHSSGNSGDKLRKAFQNIREIRGYLLIHYSPVLASLNMFQNLQIIHGQSLVNGRYALAIFEMENLKSLFNDEIEKNLIIKNGLVSFQNNPKLCFDKITKFIENVGIDKNITDTDISKYSNGEKAICNEYELKVNATTVSSQFTILSWKKVDDTILNGKQLLGYKVFWKKVEKVDSKIEIDEDRCACGDTWKMRFVQNDDKDRDDIDAWIELLSPNSVYAYYVQAQIVHHHHTNAKNIISKVGFFQTHFSIPEPPTWKQYYSPNSDTISLEWNPPLNENGVITHYTVKWAAFDKATENEHDNYDPCIPSQNKISDLPSPNIIQNSEKLYPSNYQEKMEEKSKFEDEVLNRIIGYIEYPHSENRASRSVIDTHSNMINNSSNADTDISILNAISHRTSTGHINVTTTKYNITGLKYFSVYNIQIFACQNISALEHYCSRDALITTVTTKPLPENDIVDFDTVKVYKYTVEGSNQEDSRIINWTIPKNPNGVVLGFRYRLWRDEEALSFDRCINLKDYIKNGGILIKGLSNGFYTFELRTISSAGTSERILIEKLLEVYIPGWLTWEKAFFIVIGLAAIVTVIAWLAYRHYKKYLERKVQQYLIISANSEYPLIDIYKKDEWELKREDLKFYDEIGRGSFGKVYSGEGNNITSKCEITFGKCAIKVIPECASHSERMHFLLEASVMKEFNTAFIVKLYGVVSEGTPVLLVMELMEKGNLRDFLRSRRPNSEENLSNTPVPTKQCYFKWACQIADGMAYLEAQKFVHRDLAARNCMVSNGEIVKIGDFGMARDIYYHEYYKPVGKRLMPVRWMAPESLKDGKFTVKSDIWSYGIVLYEMLTLGQQPYAGLRNDQVFEYIEKNRKIIICPSNCPKFWYNLMKKCWQYDARDRPCFYQIFLYLKDTIEKNFKNGNEEIFQVFENSFVIKNIDNNEKTNYNFMTTEEEEIRKHPLLEEIDKVATSLKEYLNNDEASIVIGETGISSTDV